jgi:hypothetical protein
MNAGLKSMATPLRCAFKTPVIWLDRFCCHTEGTMQRAIEHAAVGARISKGRRPIGAQDDMRWLRSGKLCDGCGTQIS